MSLFDDFSTELRAGLDGWFADIQSNLEAIAEAGGNAAAGGFSGTVKRVTGVLSDIVGAVPIIGGILEDVTNPLSPIEDAGGPFSWILSFGWVLGNVAYQTIQPLMLPIYHAAASAVTNEIFDPGTAATMVAKGIWSEDQGASEASGSGFDGAHFTALADAALRRPALGELLRLMNLGKIGPADVELALQREQIPQDWWGPLMALARNFLSPADLALAQLRGDLDPADAEAYATELGVTADDYQTLIGNTGEPLGLEQLLEARRRGFINDDTLARGIRQSRVRDEWISTAEALIYQRMSVADAIDATVQNYLTPEQGQAATTLAGLDPQDFQVLYETAGESMAIGEMVKLYQRGQAQLADVEQAIRESHVKDKYIPFEIAYGQQWFSVYYVKEILQAGQGDTKWAIAYLMDLGYSQDDATRFTATFSTGTATAAKKATEAQILELYSTGGLNPDEATSHLEDLGYPADQVALILAAEDAKAAASEQTKAVSAIRTKFLAGHYSKADASNLMDALGVRSSQRDLLLSDWALESAGQVKTLTESQIVDAVKYGITTFNDAQGALEALGYSPNDALYVLGVGLHALPTGVTAAPLTQNT